MNKFIEIGALYDFYSELLSDKKKEFLEYYYFDNLTLSEIAENEGITRQSVHDSIKRAEKQLFEIEEKLGLMKRHEAFLNGLMEISDLSHRINEENLKNGLSKEINDMTVRIDSVCEELKEI